jgi:acyl transferase domain-containing protein/acyl carrier protein
MENPESANCGSENHIAVIGMACRFPGADNPEQFWKNLTEGVESIVHFSDEELREQGVDDSVLRDPAVVKAAARIDHVDLFDAAFFGYSPREAEAIDPQQRIFLECAHEALERAGHDPDRFAGLVGVYGGSGVNTYLMRILAQPARDAVQSLQATVGNDKDYLSTRVSYKLNLRGPSLCVQTACSTSLVAVHLACQGLLDFECDMAIAGGVSIRAPQPPFYRYLEGSILSPDGHCRAFDAGANGTLFGNGAGVLVLRRLEDALKDGDNVLAVIRGSAINNDGAAKVGYTAPSVEGHVEAIKTAWARADLDPSTLTLMEAHGTGTLLGDPIELSALTQSFQTRTNKTGFCALGSVKTNIGHLDAAAGVASMIKTILAMTHAAIPASLNFVAPNPQFDLQLTPFFVNTGLKTWDAPGPRRAAVSSLGIGGTNAHVVLEEAPRQESGRSKRSHQLLPLSARTASALEEMTRQLYDHCSANRDLNLADVAFTYQIGRRQMPYRRVVVCDSSRAPSLPEPSSSAVFSGMSRKARPRIVFMFPGQGAQYPEMAKEIYEAEPLFREQVDSQLAFLKSELGLDLRNLIFPSNQNPTGTKELTQTSFAQPALFVVEYALAQLLISWGIRPDAMIGHSLGEFVAACLAGVFTPEQALKLVGNRARLMQQQFTGSMLAVSLSEDRVTPWLSNDLSLAVVNGPSACVISGPSPAIEDLKQRMKDALINACVLETSHAYHSEMMAPAVAPFQALVARETLQPPQIPYFSNVTGTWIEASEATDPGYWARHLHETVRFGDAVQEVLTLSDTLLLEVGPGHALSSIARQMSRDAVAIATLPARTQHDSGKSSVETLLTAVGRLWIEGTPVAWRKLHEDELRRRLPLPTYPFERQSYWIGGDQHLALTSNRQAEVQRAPIDEWFYLPLWQQSPPPSALPERTLENGCWLILHDEFSVGDRLVQSLEARGEKIVSVRMHSADAKVHPGDYVLHSRDKEGIKSLMKEIRKSGLLPHTIVNLWTVSGTAAAPTAGAAFEDFIGIIEIVQAISALGRDASVELLIVSNSFGDVAGRDEQHRPDKAHLIAAALVISQECPGIQCRCIGLAAGVEQIDDQHISQLIREMKVLSRDPLVSHHLNRWVQTYGKVSLPLRGISHTPLKDRGTYLITGGLGGLGLMVADFLARELHARLVLMNRSPFPPRESWDNLIEQETPEVLLSRINQVRQLEKAGAEVLILEGDISVQEDVERVFQEGSRKFGRIDGVFHLAGVPGAGLVQFKNTDSSARVFGPKVFGTENLSRAMQQWPADFLVMFSSIASVTGGLGQVDYCAASRFLDTVAQSAPKSGVRTISIAWDAWQSDTWQDSALASFPKLRDLLKQRRKQYGITASEGMEVLQRVLASSLSHVIVSTQDLKTTIENHDRYSRTVVSEQAQARSAAEPSRGRSSLSVPRVPPRNPLEENIAALWEEVLGVRPVGIHDDFIELGGHSLLAIELTARLREAFHIELPLKAIFECPTVSALANLISKEKSMDGASPQIDIEELLAEVERLSPEEVVAQLEHLQQ